MMWLFSFRKEEESKYAESHKILVLDRPEDKKQKENETAELLHRARIICFYPRVDVDDQLMIVNVETLRRSCPQHYFFTERLIILMNISKLSKCLQ